MTVSSLVVSFKENNWGSPSSFPYSLKCLRFNSDIEYFLMIVKKELKDLIF